MTTSSHSGSSLLCCPRCKGHDISRKHVGYPVFSHDDRPVEFVDKVVATCRGCGWRGKVSDLIPESKESA